MKKILELENVSKSISWKHGLKRKMSTPQKILDKINLVLEAGKIYSLVGGNGAGKTSLLNIIQNYTTKSSGKITYYGNEQPVDISSFSPTKLRGLGHGRLFQNLLVFESLNLLENMYLGCLEDKFHNPLLSIFQRKKILEIEQKNEIKALEIWDSILGKNNYFANNCYTSAASLSFGQQRILALCRLLMIETNLILLDEPTSGVSEELIPAIKDILIKLKESGTTLILVEHNIPFITSISNQVIWLDNGKIKMHDKLNIVINDSSFKKEFL
jgi:ABC-type branched-subunit amino acid transport system ATPase component